MYQLKKELYSVAGACGVRLEGDKKQELKIIQSNKVKYIPEFVEGEEDNFFLQFEKNPARLRKWSEEEWTFLIQTKFKVKAREAFVNLSDQEAGDYELIKEAMLGSTHLSPGVQRKRFHNVKKRQGNS